MRIMLANKVTPFRSVLACIVFYLGLAFVPSVSAQEDNCWPVGCNSDNVDEVIKEKEKLREPGTNDKKEPSTPVNPKETAKDVADGATNEKINNDDASKLEPAKSENEQPIKEDASSKDEEQAELTQDDKPKGADINSSEKWLFGLDFGFPYVFAFKPKTDVLEANQSYPVNNLKAKPISFNMALYSRAGLPSYSIWSNFLYGLHANFFWAGGNAQVAKQSQSVELRAYSYGLSLRVAYNFKVAKRFSIMPFLGQGVAYQALTHVTTPLALNVFVVVPEVGVSFKFKINKMYLKIESSMQSYIYTQDTIINTFTNSIGVDYVL